jgi:hypothetical protein
MMHSSNSYDKKEMRLILEDKTWGTQQEAFHTLTPAD